SFFSTLFLVAGFAGLALNTTLFFLSTTLMPLNYLAFIEFGVVLGICSLSYKHAAQPKLVKRFVKSETKRLRAMRRKPAITAYRFLYSVSKIPHSPIRAESTTGH
ncbi:MAG TPA: hypothetical protein VFW90_00565, partial [Candidatus Saccharimonadales bacterium]|nr:hypothetical protein [Candidatus Saccharimonadales bacterium]